MKEWVGNGKDELLSIWGLSWGPSISKYSPFIPKALYPKKADELENRESQLGIYPGNTKTLI